MVLLLMILACGGPPKEAVEARERLVEAMVSRDPAQVGPAARQAALWVDRDPALPLLLGDALANVLMRPDEGWAMLEAYPALDNRDWVRARRGAALRSGDLDRMYQVATPGTADTRAFDHPVVEQIVLRARQDPSVGWESVQAALRACRFLDSRPPVGRQTLDLPASGHLVEAARVLGASDVVIAQSLGKDASQPLDPNGPLRCRRYQLNVDGALPDRLQRSWVIAGSGGGVVIFLDLVQRPEGRWVFASSDAEAGAVWARAALALEAGESPPPGGWRWPEN